MEYCRDGRSAVFRNLSFFLAREPSAKEEQKRQSLICLNSVVVGHSVSFNRPPPIVPLPTPPSRDIFGAFVSSCLPAFLMRRRGPRWLRCQGEATAHTRCVSFPWEQKEEGPIK